MVTGELVRRAGAGIAREGARAGAAAAGIYRLLGSDVLVGPAGSALHTRVADRHRDVRRAVGDAAYRADEVGRALTPPVRVPEPALPAPGAGPSSRPGVAEGSPSGIAELVRVLDRAARTWISVGEEISRLLTSLGAPSGPGRRIARAGADLRVELPDLRRRRDLLKAAADPTRQEWIKASNALMKTLMGENHSLYTSLINSGLHPMDIPVHDPQAAATWWSHLTPRQQSLYTRAFPSTIGWTDGLPTPARDKANRQTLTTRLTHLESLPPTHQTPFETRDLTRLRQLVGQIERLEGGGLKVRLIGFDSTVPGEWDSFGGGGLKFGLRLSAISDGLDGPDGRLILSIGDPDSADNVAVYVPGTTAQIDSIRGDLDRAANLWRRSVKYGSGSVATIVWLGYDAPDTILKDAPVDKYAEAGAPKLLRFIDGLPAGSSKHVTAIGHSYGSVVIGEAAIRGDLKVDEVIAVGSPGMHVGEAKDLDVKPENVWVMAATGDPVPQIGRFTHGGAAINGVSVVPQVPSDEGFGANILATDTRGHSAYWAEESQSLDNQAKVIMGGHFTPEQSDDPVLAERPRLYR